MEKSEPRAFIDAVAPNRFRFNKREKYGHDRFPEIANLVARKFKLIDEIEGVRIYARK
jgi:hypothetical protein